ncbi:hypothetical protein [Streptomyces sp. H27-S2]|uniref:hypothetical protein n=1 Tax=Streptomyces antarcticus TaxID=2996458 RepID=UPI0022700184|nr:hypothetical protein [Streptomyces sp. H27-S2]MCY0951216.1 hypothetical protein [Streptomyces sp. H27-S2]
MSSRRGRSRTAVASGALLLAVLASSAGQTGSALAAPSPPASTDTAVAAAAATAPQAPTGPGAAPKPDPKPDPKADHAAAVRALRASDPAGACPPALTPHTVVNCTVPASTTTEFTLTLPQQKDLVLIQAVAAQGSLWPRLTAPDGSAVTCENVRGSGSADGALRCPTTGAGTYRLSLLNNSGTETGASVAYAPLLSTTVCKPVGPADRKLGAPTVFKGSLAVGSAGDCYAPALAANDVLRTYATSYRVLHSVYDATGKELCSSLNREGDALDCKLAGTAPFRVSVLQSGGAAEAYDFTAARLSKPEGCPVIEPQAYGASPDLGSTARCRVLRVPAAARYSVTPVSAGSVPYGTLFTAAGAPATGCSEGACDLTPGDHTWVVDPRNTDAGAFGIAFHSPKETRGCTATHDNGLVAGAVAGTFAGPGQLHCLTLPTATGKGVYLLNRPPADGTYASPKVYDATGALQCDGSPESICKLTGTAPFRVVLTGDPGAFGLVVHRTGEAAGCTPWPQTSFGASSGAQVQLPADVRQACLSLPADKHSAAEMLDYTNLQNKLNATVRVVDPAGNEACATGYSSTTTSCALTAGVPYTALLVGWGGEDSYTLVRRDVSPAANCTTPASTKVGGPSTPFDLTSALDARCVKVTAAATDKLWFSSRTLGSRYEPTTTLVVVDPSGRIACWQHGVSCQVTGSTSYVAVVTATGYEDKPIHSNVDTWKVATAAGWAPECTANQVSPEGFPVRGAVLSETSTAYCAVLDMKPGQSFNVYGTSSATNGEHPWTDLLSASEWSAQIRQYTCLGTMGQFATRCGTGSDAPAGQAVLLVSPRKATTPVEFSMQGVCDRGCTPPQNQIPTGISPSASATGTKSQAVVSGTGLTLGTKLRLVRGNGVERALTPVSVNPAGTALTVQVDAVGLDAGVYDLVREGVGYTSGVPSPGYLPNAYTVTAAPTTGKSRFVPLTPARFLDTRDGTGATKQRVGPGGVVTLQVAGLKGVPATGVTAVVMNVTAVDPTHAGHVKVYPNGRPVPGVSNLNFAAGQIVPNLVTVSVVNGKVDLRNNAGSVDLIADVTGYYTDKADTGSAYKTITPSRFLDTRDGTGAKQQRVGPGGIVSLQVTGVKGVPASGVTAVVMNVTAVEPTTAGHVTVYPNGQTVPGVSNLNFTAGQIVPNLVIVPVVNGKVDLRNNAGSVDLIADVTGYYSATGSTYSSGNPVRLLDTRDGTGARAGAVGQGGAVSLRVAGVEGVPADGVTAVILNVTVTNPTTAGHLIVHPYGVTRPNVSNLNFTAGQTVSNLVVVPVVDGKVTFYNHSGSVDVIADLSGYFTG